MPHVKCAVVGAGPGGVACVTELYRAASKFFNESAYDARHVIAWIDPEFKLGDFGTVLSDVPGNTKVGGYKDILNSMYCLIGGERPVFELDTLDDDHTCPLRAAAEPLQYITTELRKKVYSVEGQVQSIQTTPEGFFELYVDSQSETITADELILVVGAELKTLDLGLEQVCPNTLFAEKNIKVYLDEHGRENKKFAIVGSSHSAALAVMHVLQEGIPVKQFMNKAYKFAEEVIEGGVMRIKHDNTGLKGKVALFIKKLLQAKGIEQGIIFRETEQKEYEQYAALWECAEGANVTHGDERLLDCTHAGVCIGYQPRSSLTIDGMPLSSFHYNSQTAELLAKSGQAQAHIHVMGIGHPEEKVSPEGSEFDVGVTKFSSSAAKIVQKIALFGHEQSRFSSVMGPSVVMKV